MNSMIGACILTSVCTMSVVMVCYLYMIKELREIENRAIRRHALLEDWLFQSLYSLNNKVLLPTEADKPLDTKPAKVFSPSEDPMSEFNGQMDDL